MDLQSMRAYVRQHLEVDDEELPDTILNVYFQDAFGRTLAVTNLWPKQEATWELALISGETSVAMPPECLLPSILSVKDVAHGYRLVQVAHEDAEDRFSGPNIPITTGTPVYYSLWAQRMYLWPRPQDNGEDYQLVVRGYAQPIWSNEASYVPAIDERLHIAMCYFVMSLAYAAQEDEILEGVYLSRWDRDVAQQSKMILEAPRHRPLVMNGGAYLGGYSSYVIVPPDEGP